MAIASSDRLVSAEPELADFDPNTRLVQAELLDGATGQLTPEGRSALRYGPRALCGVSRSGDRDVMLRATLARDALTHWLLFEFLPIARQITYRRGQPTVISEAEAEKIRAQAIADRTLHPDSVPKPDVAA